MSDFGCQPPSKFQQRNDRMGQSAEPFYAIANDVACWAYTFDKIECQGLWPLEALCLALLLDEGTRCDVALVVAFARGLKTAGHILTINVHTRREVALYDATEEVRSAQGYLTQAESHRRYFLEDASRTDAGEEKIVIRSDVIDRREAELPMMRRYSSVMHCVPRGDRIPSAKTYTFKPSTWTTIVNLVQLPPKERIALVVAKDRNLNSSWREGVVDVLCAAVRCDSLDVAVIVCHFVVVNVDSASNFYSLSSDYVISSLSSHGMRQFHLLCSILLKSEAFRLYILGAPVYWDTLWECQSPQDAAIVAKTFQVAVPDVFKYSKIRCQLSRHQAAIYRAVHDALGKLHEVDFGKLLPFLNCEAIAYLHAEGCYDKLFSVASAWLQCHLISDDPSLLRPVYWLDVIGTV